MKIFTNFLILVLTPAVLLTSCGNENDDDNPPITQREEEDQTPAPAPTPSPTPQPSPDRDIRYSAFEMKDMFFGYTEYETDFNVKMEFNKRPLVISSDFEEKTVDDYGEVINVQRCTFNFQLSKAEANKLESIADNVKICSFYNEDISDGAFTSMDVTYPDGREKMVLKYKSSEVLGRHLYLCGGRAKLYQYVGDLVKAQAPSICPESYKDMFED